MAKIVRRFKKFRKECPQGYEMLDGICKKIRSVNRLKYPKPTNPIWEVFGPGHMGEIDDDVMIPPGSEWQLPGPGEPGSNVEECFIAGTKVLLSDNSYKNIEDITIGESVKSYNVETNQIEDKSVINLLNDVHSGKDGDHTIIMKFSDGSQNHNTTTNPYWVKDKSWATFDVERHKELYKWDCEKIEVGDICYKHVDGKLEEIELVSKINTSYGIYKCKLEE